MPKCTSNEIEFGGLGRRQIVANFDGGEISSEGGLMLLRQVDRKIGLTRSVVKVLCVAYQTFVAHADRAAPLRAMPGLGRFERSRPPAPRPGNANSPRHD